MSGSQYDVVVVGGGIQGVGVAQAAAADGHSVLLLEKTRLAAGTSSKSSKLIHGGLRYLESGEISLVQESLNERNILLKMAPDLVEMKRFMIPIYKDTRRAAWQISVGLKMYYALARFRQQAKPGRISRSKWDTLDGLSTEKLRAVFYYSDAQTDDQRLTKAVMHSAQTLDAELKMPAEFTKAIVHDDGCDITYNYNGEQHSCSARVLVNAGGPWVNKIAKRISPTPELQDIELVAGSHIVLDGEVTQGIYYTESPRDGRAVFVMPWYGQLMVGTTERSYKGQPEKITPTVIEKNYLLSVLAHYFPKYKGTAPEDLSDSWAGLRVLPGGDEHAFHKTREVIYKTDDKYKPKVISVYGGKLTAYRATAQHVMDQICPSLPKRKRRGSTERLPLEPVD